MKKDTFQKMFEDVLEELAAGAHFARTRIVMADGYRAV
jgi:hypothetical protein